MRYCKRFHRREPNGCLPYSKGSSSHVVFRETDTGKLQPLPEVPGKGKEKITDPYQTTINLSIEVKEKSCSSRGTISSLQHLAKDFSFGDQFLNDKPSEADNEKTTANTEAKSMCQVSYSIKTPLSFPPIHHW
ncbi:hypothetical protein Tco_0524702 [Tanacetum coccineum]